MDILTNIHNKLGTLSKGKQRIARYLLESCEQAAFQTAGLIGKTVQVSESTVVRFAVDLGYDGYPEMQKALQEVVRNRLSNAQQTEMKYTPKEDLLSSVLRSDIQQLRRTMEKLDRRAFDGAVEGLLQARRIYILGVCADAPLAAFLHYNFDCIFEDVRCIVSGADSEILRQLVRISPRDVLLSVSFSPASAAVSKAMEFARQAGAQIIALTDGDGECADNVLCVKRNQTSFADSMAAPMSVLNALIAAVYARRKQETAETLERLKVVY